MFAIELTGNSHMLLPLLAAPGTAYAVTVLLLKRSILTEKIARRGRHLTREYSTDPFETLRVADIMVPKVDALEADMTVDAAVAFFMDGEKRHKSYPVLDKDRKVVGMASRADVLAWQTEAAHGEATLYDQCSDSDVVVAYPDDLLGHLADLMVEHDIGRIPIVARDSRRLVGLVARKDMLRIRSVRNAQEHERTGFFGPRGARGGPLRRRRRRKAASS
jgi:CBS domain-containing protein